MTSVFLANSVFPFFSLLTSASDSASEAVSDFGDGAVRLAIQYGWYFVIIVVGVLLLALVKRKAKKNLTPEAVRQRCAVLAKKLEETLSEDKKAKKNILNSTKILKLRSLAEDAMWNALRLVDERKDMVFENVANGLDGVANLLSELSEDSFSETRETETQLRAALENVNGLIVQIDDIVAARKG